MAMYIKLKYPAKISQVKKYKTFGAYCIWKKQNKMK